ncbi:MAG: hypothetical protein K1000chlam4_00146, partial [Chlamydiae bacterium]|nr:hypothetical protein [Chlamydiota bacterium]
LVFWELDAEVEVIGDDPDGFNINANCGSLFPEKIQKGVVEKGCDVGIAFDGDGDRVIMSDEKGKLVDGDTILAIAAREMKKQGRLKNNRVVTTTMTNLGVTRFLEGHGIEVIHSRIGDRYVIQDMLTHDANLGGEQSGHLIFLDYNTTGDGIVAALQILSIMQATGTTLSELASEVKKFPQTQINTPVKEKPPLKTLKHLQQEIKNAELSLGQEGRVLVRYSGTENVCRTMVEGVQEKQVQELATAISRAVKQEIGD